MTQFVAGGLLVQRAERLRMLLCRRSETRLFYPNIWDVPGGHSEPGEDAEQTLVRELAEEVGVVPTEWRPFGHLDLPAQAHAQAMVLYLFEVTAWTGTPSNLQPEEHAELAWFTIEEASKLPLAHPAYVHLFPSLAATP